MNAPKPDDLVERATNELCSRPIPDGPPESLIAATVAAIPQPPPTVMAPSWRKVMRLIGYSSLATAAAILIATTVFLTTARPTAAAEFQAAMKNANKARNMVVMTHQKLSKNSHDLHIKYSFQGHLQAMDFMMPKEEGKAETIHAMTMKFDFEKSLSITLDHVHKAARYGNVDGKLPDLISGFRNLEKNKDITLKGEEKIGDVVTKVYTTRSIEFMGGTGEADVTIWIDPAKKLPVKVKFESDVYDKDKKPISKMVIEFNDIQFDVKLKDDTFSMDVPKGYAKVE